MEILFPAARCPRFYKQYPYEYSLREIHFPSVRSGIPYRVCFLINFHARYLTIIGPPWIFTTIQLLYTNSLSSSYRGGACVREKGGWIPRDGFNWISNRKRIVKTRFGYVFVSKGDVSVKRRGGRRCVHSRLCIIVTALSFLSLLESRIWFLFFLFLRGNPIQRRYEKKKSVRALINLRFECISYFRIV